MIDKIIQPATLKKEATTELSIQKQQEVEHVLIGVIKPKKGQFVWELNEETGTVEKAKYKNDTVALFGAKKKADELIMNPNCVYIPAVNKKNAIKKYLKNKEQSFYYAKEPAFNFSDII